MTPLLALLLAASPPPEAPAASTADARQVLRVVLAFETQIHRAAEVGPPPCVLRRVGEDSLGGRRLAVEEYERPRPPRPPRPAGTVITVVDAAELHLSPFSHWEHLSATNRGYFGRGRDLSPEADAQMAQAERTAMIGPRQRRRVREIDPAWIGPPLRFCRRGDEFPRLEIGSPTFTGDLAFVWSRFECVLCGQGVILALRRSGRRWEIAAVALKWVS